MRCLFLLLTAMVFASPVLADPAPGAIMQATPQAERECAQNYKIQTVRLAQLAAMLDLTPAQKPLFDAWRKARLALWSAVPCPALPTGLDTPALQRIRNQITMASATLNGLHEELPAAEALYNALTPEQRTAFDGPIRLAAPPPAAPSH